jgi:5-methyltetrahydropteroyltriglutamate--homocysteine methyltransferase
MIAPQGLHEYNLTMKANTQTGPVRTSVVGSYPQPEWLIDQNQLKNRLPPRVRAKEIWLVDEQYLEQAQDDATILAIRDQERAGVDIITDGEIRRESYSNRLANAFEGIDRENNGEIISRGGSLNQVPLVSGPIKRAAPIEVADAEFLCRHTERGTKITLPGPFTLSQQAVDNYYNDEEELAMAYAAAVNEEIHDLFATGVDVVQLDEPWLESRPESAKRFAVKVINRALAGVQGTTAIHLCFGYAALIDNKTSDKYTFLAELDDCVADQISIEAAQPGLDLSILPALSSKTMLVGVIDLGTDAIETSDTVATRMRWW